MMSIYCHLSGVGIVTAYLVDIFASTLNALTLVLISSFTVVVGSCLQMCAADMLGRKVFLVFCGSGMGLAAIIFAAIFWVSSNPESLIFGSSLLSQILSNNILVVLILVLFLGSFQFGFAPMRYTLLSELFIPREQETVGSLDHSTFWFFGFVTTKMFHLLYTNYGLATIFVGIFCVCISSIIFTLLVIPETRERSRREVDQCVQGSANEAYVSTGV